MSNYNIAKLMKMTNIEIKKDESDKFVESVNNILSWAEGLQKVDTNGVEPMFSIFDVSREGLINLREDVVYDGNYQDKILNNAPDKEDVFICVPKVIDQD